MLLAAQIFADLAPQTDAYIYGTTRETCAKGRLITRLLAICTGPQDRPRFNRSRLFWCVGREQARDPGKPASTTTIQHDGENLSAEVLAEVLENAIK